MINLFCTTGVTGELIDWSLVSQQADNGMVRSVYEAPCVPLHRTYHMETIKSDRLDAQHLSIL